MLTLAVTSKTLPLTQVEDLADIRIAEKLSQLSGVGLVPIAGGMRPALRIQVNPRALAAYGIAIDDIRTDITNENTDMPKGNFDGPTQNSTINDNDQLQTAEDYRNLILAYKNGGADPPLGRGDHRQGPGEHRAGRLGQPNPRHHRQRAAPAGHQCPRGRRRGEDVLPKLQQTLPAGIDVTILSDQTATIRASISDVEFELGLAVVLVVLVIFIFLRTCRRPSFRAFPFRCRSSARSPECICSASLSTICP